MPRQSRQAALRSERAHKGWITRWRNQSARGEPLGPKGRTFISRSMASQKRKKSFVRKEFYSEWIKKPKRKAKPEAQRVWIVEEPIDDVGDDFY